MRKNTKNLFQNIPYPNTELCDYKAIVRFSWLAISLHFALTASFDAQLGTKFVER